MKIKKIIAYLLVLTLFFTNLGFSYTYANNIDNTIPDLILSEEEVKIFNEYLSNQKENEFEPKIYVRNAAASGIAGGLGSLAGSFFIPGVGQAVITIGGTIIVAGITVSAVSSIGKKVIKWVQNYKIQEYNKAKNAGKKTKDHSTQSGGSLPVKGKPNSSKDLKDSKGLKQRRYYDKNGNADLDIDYRHGGNGKEPFPHKHKWTNGKRGKWFK